MASHNLHIDTRKVTQYSSAGNLDYPSTETWLVCSCGYQRQNTALLGEMRREERLMRLEHLADVQSKEK